MELNEHNPSRPIGGQLGSVKSKKTKILRYERKLAEKSGGRARLNSGSMDGYKGDYVLDDFLADNKSTDSQSYRIDTDLLVMLCRQANSISREPLISLTFNKIASTAPKEWALIPYSAFLRLIRKDEE